jgi:hypothetical protein
MNQKDLDAFEKKCPCGIQWDRRGNVKSVVYCVVHRAAPRLLEAAENLFAESTRDKVTSLKHLRKVVDEIRVTRRAGKAVL